MELTTLRFEAGDDGVATVTLDRPQRLNAFTSTTCDELAALWRHVRADDAVRAVVLTGRGDEAFCTGTFAGVVPVRSVDGRAIGAGDAALPGPMVQRLQALYRDLVARDVAFRAGQRLA